MLGRHDGKGQKARARADEGEQQRHRRHRIGTRVCQGEAHHHGGVEQEIETDVQKATGIGAQAGMPRQRAIQPVHHPIDQDRDQREPEMPISQQRQRQHADGEAREGQLIRMQTARRRTFRKTFQRRLYPA